MKLRALIFFLTLPMLLVIVESCDLFCGGGGCCGDFSETVYEIDDVDLISNQTSAVRYDSINVNAQFNFQTIGQHFYKKSTFWVNEAYGCSPPEPLLNDTLTDIRVIANNDYNSTYQTGTLLNDIIMIEDIWNGIELPLAEYLANSLDLNLYYGLEYQFNFSEAPSDTIEHSFTIEFIFGDKTVTGTTESLTITP